MPRLAMTDEALGVMRERLLAATGRIIAGEGGYSAFSMRRLAKEVGLTAGALYRYFPTRQHVLVAYWSDSLGELHRRFEVICADRKGVRDQLEAMLLAYADFAIENPDRFRVLFLENDLGQFSRFGDMTTLLKGYELFLERVEAALTAGIIRPLPVAVAAHVLWGTIHGVVSLAITVEQIDFGDARKLAEVASATVLRGLFVSGDRD
ncbi:TetR/AcrR family transcriptional regulator [Mesorhizobium sp. CU2]|uniref:TetR/AcrR family transcriptional regulator n=1 Tax=unclassified Mesorhizobium TaxID=325217 RepID=UPI00112D33A0|nr:MULTISPECIES: TetR/AcrR family transcriptional regulator [unclassified Mesorhizobium]TPN81148.1 TetR/AcrR family transcriptional regulator [Mesorhizobium sp. CU3]TPO17053.1 TetR/AcrR family transcriptional regulator [Mesorhizobium sp. CU2]